MPAWTLTPVAAVAYGAWMPSPVGHVLGGLLAGLSVLPAPGRVGLAVTAAAAVLPDVDFLWGRHNMETHSLGAAVAAGLAVCAWTCGRRPSLAVAVSLAWASHVLFDWLGSDDTPPVGVMALWPWSSAFYFGDAFVFDAVSRRYWLPGFVAHNLWAVGRELVLLLPPVVVLALVRDWRPWRRSAQSGCPPAGPTVGTGSSTSA